MTPPLPKDQPASLRLRLKNPKEMPLLEHLAELRIRILRALLAALGGSVIGLIFCRQIFDLLKAPMMRALPEGSSFIATSPFESYMTYFKVSLVAGFFLASPFIFYQLWRFLAPALETKERKQIFPFSLISAFLFTGGALFGYFVVFPTGFYYVNLVLEGTGIKLMPKMSDYLNVALMLLISFGVSFELPLVIFLLGKLGVIDYNFIKQYRRYVIVCLFILAAILTPGPDVISQCLLALPLWGLFELGGLSLRLIKKQDNQNSSL